MNFIRKFSEQIFYILLAITIFIFFLPGEAKMAVYTPNYLGWFWFIFLIPITLICFVLLSIIDFKQKNYKVLIFRTVVFIVAVLICIGFGFYMVNKNGHL